MGEHFFPKSSSPAKLFVTQAADEFVAFGAQTGKGLGPAEMGRIVPVPNQDNREMNGSQRIGPDELDLNRGFVSGDHPGFFGPFAWKAGLENTAQFGDSAFAIDEVALPVFNPFIFGCINKWIFL